MCGFYFDKGALTEEWNRAAEKITGYHVHIYVGDGRHSIAALHLAGRLRALFDKDTRGPWEIGRIGPHTQNNVEVDIKNPEAFGKIVSWLQMNKTEGLSILIHPRTGDELDDHANGIWIGTPVPFNDAFFAPLRDEKARLNGPGR